MWDKTNIITEYEKCWEKERECSWDEVFEKFGGRVTNI